MFKLMILHQFILWSNSISITRPYFGVVPIDFLNWPHPIKFEYFYLVKCEIRTLTSGTKVDRANR